MRPVWIVLIALAALLVLFIAASYLFTEQMSPILDPLLYTKEELELLRG
jgi:type VI protein secretion system component VasF